MSGGWSIRAVCEAFREELAEHLGPHVEVIPDWLSGGLTPDLLVSCGRFYLRICGMEARDMLEPDPNSWEAYGITGLAADIMIFSMSAARVPKHRIPPRYGRPVLKQAASELLRDYCRARIGEVAAAQGEQT